MQYVVAIVVGAILSWILLLIVIPIARRIADFSLPPWPETLWKLAVVAVVGSTINVVLDPVNTWISLIASFVVFMVFMVKWFDVDFFGAVIIVVVSQFVRYLLYAAIVAALMSRLGS